MSDTVAAAVNTGAAILPVIAPICETGPATGQCLATPAAQLSLTCDGGTTPTLSVFLTATGPIPFAPGTSRVFGQFTDATESIRGATSVAVETVSP